MRKQRIGDEIRSEPWNIQDELLKNFRLYVLEKCKFNRTHTAIVLGVPLNTVREFIKRYTSMGYIIPGSTPRIGISAEDMDDVMKWVEYRKSEHLRGAEAPR